MDKKSIKARNINFGKLGYVEISSLEYEAPNVYAKNTSSSIPACPMGQSSPGDSGAPFDDDQACMPTLPFTS